MRLSWLAAGMVVLAALAFGAAYAIFKPHPVPVVRSSILPPPGTSFLSLVVGTFPPVLSPDGTRLAFTARDEQGKVLLYVRQLSSLAAQPAGFHTFATLRQPSSTKKPENLKLVQKLLGHSNLSTTADVYTHTSADADRSAALALEQAIFGDLFQVVPRFGTWNKNAAAN